MSTPAAPVEPMAAPAVEKEPAPAPVVEPKASVPDIPESPRPQTKSFPTARRAAGDGVGPCPGMSRLRRYRPYRKRDRLSPLQRFRRQHLPGVYRRPGSQPTPQGGRRGRQSLRAVERGRQALTGEGPDASQLPAQIEGVLRWHGCSSTAARPSGTSSVSTRTASGSSKAHRAGVRRRGADRPLRAPHRRKARLNAEQSLHALEKLGLDVSIEDSAKKKDKQ